MDEQEIKQLFLDHINRKEASKDTGLTKKMLYNYRHDQAPGIGTMLKLLLEWNLITITKNESTGTTQ